MKSTTNTTSNKKDDLTFVPLNIQDPFKFDGSNFEPLVSFDGVSISNSSNNIFIGFPPLMTNDKFICEPFSVSPMPIMPYPLNVPNLESINLPNNVSDIINYKKIQKSNNPTSGDIQKSIIETDLQYPSEVDSDDLYSYNKTRLNNNYDFSLVNPLDILREFDLQDEDLIEGYRVSNISNDINRIFKDIEENNSVILATMKAYRIPYPIAKLLIKKIIKLTLDYSKK